MNHPLSLTFFASGESTWICTSKSSSSNGFSKNPEFILDCTFCKDIIADVESQIMDPSNMIEVRQFHTKIIKSSTNFRIASTCKNLTYPLISFIFDANGFHEL